MQSLEVSTWPKIKPKLTTCCKQEHPKSLAWGPPKPTSLSSIHTAMQCNMTAMLSLNLHSYNMMKQSETDLCSLAALKLPLSPPPPSPEHPSTPPLQPPVSVPFHWEEEPGKPRSCPARPTQAKPLKLELPPGSRIMTGLPSPSPTSVLDGPGNVGRPKFSSFRLYRSSNQVEEEGDLFGRKKSRLGLLGRFNKSHKRVVDGGSSCRFSPGFDTTTDKRVKGQSMRWNGSFSNVSNTNSKAPHFLASIYQGLKHAIQRKGSQKLTKDGQC